MRVTPKLYKDGTHRCIAPTATIENAMPHLATMGITRIANVAGLDRLGIPVVNAYRPNSRSLSVSQGKGSTLEAAKASAIMEAVESYHAELIDLPLKRGSYQNLIDNSRLIQTDGLPFLAGTRFDPSREILWVEGGDLMSSESVWLPFELVHTDYTVNGPDTAGCFVASTNGLASGNHQSEAIIHGICEVIERDAHTLWHFASIDDKAVTRIDLTSISDTSCQALIHALNEKGMTVGVWDMTSDTEIATFYCIILDKNGRGHSGAGAGTHLDSSVALSRAITEAVQVRTNYITGARDDLEWEEYEHSGIAQKNRYAENLLEAQTSQMKSIENVPSCSFEFFNEDINWLLKRLSHVGVGEVISVDLTKSEFGIPVVRVVIPGLEGPHDHNDYCPGHRAKHYFSQGKA